MIMVHKTSISGTINTFCVNDSSALLVFKEGILHKILKLVYLVSVEFIKPVMWSL